jgi:hypothetical protein
MAGSTFLAVKVRYAPSMFRSATCRTKAGMSISTGHPATHGWFLHWMQRSASWIAISIA